MKKVLIVLSAILLSAITSCEKDGQNNGTILAKVVYNGDKVPYAMISLFSDTTGNPIETKRTDAIGEAYFCELRPGTYYLIATGNWYYPYINLCGNKVVYVLYRTGLNHYDAVIETKQCK